MIKTAFGLAPYSSLRVVGLQRGAYTRIALLSLALGAGACGDDHDTDADVGMDASASNHDTDPTKTEPMKAGSGSNHVVDDAGPGSGPMTNDASMMMDKPHGSVEGVVYRADTLKPVSGAVITGPDGIQAKTDKHGKFKLTMLQTERTALLANAKNFAQAVEPVSVVADQSTAIEFRLLHVSAKADVDSSKGGQVRAASGAEVVIDKAAFVDANGKPVTGMVTVELTVLDPSSAAGMEAFPGDFTATSKKGNDGQLESFVPMEITVRQGDDVLDFASGKGADVSFPVPEALKDKAPQTIALWSLSETTGAWVEEGTATLITDGAGMLVYRGRLTHMSWWNCDRFIDSVTCIRGCVTLDGKPAASVETQAEGIDYSNLGMDRTGSDGCFAEDVKAGGQLRVRALSDDAATEWKVITASDTRMSVRDDRKKCMDVGTLELIERKPADVGCPAGSTKCGSTCVDLASDYDNCGSCDNSCFGSKANGTQCINSKCSCAASETRCPGDGPDVCTDVNFDEANCGKCGARCGSGQTCEAGTCKKLACEDGLTRCGSSCVDVDDNSLHCGECNAACDAGETCSAGACKKLSCGATFEKCGNECVAEGTCPKSDVGGDNGGNAGSNGGNAGSNGGNAGSSGGNAGSNGGGGSGTAGATGGGGGTNGGSAGSNGGGGSGTAGATGGGGSDGEGGNDGSGGFGGGAGASGGTDGGTGNPGDEPDGGFGGGGFGGFGGHGGTGGFGGGRDGGTGNPGDEPDGGFGGGGFGGFGGHGGGGGFGGGTDAGMGGSLDAGIGGGGDCLPGEFYCPSDLNCVPMAWRCNGDEDCSGGEDEVHCGVTVCPGEFECHVDQSCISFTQFCDLLEDCPDGEDEQHCGGGGPMCPPQMFPCPDNTCVDSPEQCTTTSCPPDAVQCPDGDCAPSPEQCGGGISCAKGQMQCVGEAGPTCATMCDQLAECSNGMDENPFTCCEQSGGMMCNTGDHLDCVSADHVCADDGTQCADGQDEDPGMCCDQHDGMMCSDGDGQEICVSASQVCADDGAQCANGQDEDPQRCCSKDRGFFCAGSQDCIDNAKLCDQVPDCADGSDESLNNCGCPGGGFACSDGSMCIDASLRCDGGLPDCNDGSDEEHCGCPEGKVTCPNQTCADDFSACPPVK